MLMFTMKKHLSRRTVLRGLGGTIALPFLEAMVPALTPVAKTAASPLMRFAVVFVPLGERPGYWTPSKAGADFEFTPILKPLEPFRNWITVVSELCNPLDGHAVSVAAWLSGSVPFRTIAENVRAGTTVDQLIANKIGQDTPFPSLELATEDFTGWIGGCDTAYSCAYMNTISWKNPTTPLPMEINPRVVFERMFGRPGTRGQRLERMQENRSILDSVRQDVNDLERKLGTKDRARLNDYLDNLREIEQRIQKAEKQAATSVNLPDAPIGIPESFDEHASIMYDLMAVAFESNVTRVITYMKSRDASQRVYPNIGVMEPHHAMSHHGNNPEKIAGLVKVNTYHTTLFAKFLERLKSTPDGDGSLLDHALILYGSGMSESDTHSRLNLPTVLVGGAAGQMKGNRYIQAAKETPVANLMVSLANKFDCDIDKFGISTGSVEI
jgi:Protein of unknown function (DUF1552)